MFASNPFAVLADTTIPLDVIQGYVILMFLLVVGGTIFDTIHKKSAKYFFAKAKAAEANRTRTLGAGDKIGIAINTVAVDVMTAGEFCNPMRRLSHILMMYGFILFVLTTVALVFAYPTSDAPAIVSMLWHVGAAMVMLGGFWFRCLLRVDKAAEGNPWYRIVKADMFILSLLGTTTFGLVWSLTMGVATWNTVFLGLFIISATVLFGGVLWSKFAHMFFKPAAAYNKRIIKADGSMDNLPTVGDLTDPALQKRYPDIPEYMGKSPAYMGLGIKREEPKHY
ncbi:MAG: adenylyl-sulfate reductase [Alphaproteobacteria bacterium]|nr:adenylyl-sulfate reductase [Alphaproteobacteria bacterium]MBF0250515.1 adenylyl-sulfate reductase [Alphaproteobacteria bacterium]